jgi:hypothetical protein
MIITRKSIISGTLYTRDLDVTQAQLGAYEDGALLQDAFPHLSADDREFIKTGISALEWLQMSGCQECDE